MKKLCFLLIFALLLNLGASAFAEDGVEIIVMDGIPVVMEFFDLQMRDTATLDAADGGAGFTLPAELAEIREEAFMGIPAERVEITAQVSSIGARAFAACPNLREIVIPETVTSIDDSALQGSENVTVYGKTGSEAQRFADAAGVSFVDLTASGEHQSFHALMAPVVMPFVAFD